MGLGASFFFYSMGLLKNSSIPTNFNSFTDKNRCPILSRSLDFCEDQITSCVQMFVGKNMYKLVTCREHPTKICAGLIEVDLTPSLLTTKWQDQLS